MITEVDVRPLQFWCRCRSCTSTQAQKAAATAAMSMHSACLLLSGISAFEKVTQDAGQAMMGHGWRG